MTSNAKNWTGDDIKDCVPSDLMVKMTSYTLLSFLTTVLRGTFDVSVYVDAGTEKKQITQEEDDKEKSIERKNISIKVLEL